MASLPIFRPQSIIVGYNYILLLISYDLHLYFGWSPKSITWNTKPYTKANLKLTTSVLWDELKLIHPTLYLSIISLLLILSKIKAYSQCRGYILGFPLPGTLHCCWFRSVKFELKCPVFTEGSAASSTNPSLSISTQSFSFFFSFFLFGEVSRDTGSLTQSGSHLPKNLPVMHVQT